MCCFSLLFCLRRKKKQKRTRESLKSTLTFDICIDKIDFKLVYNGGVFLIVFMKGIFFMSRKNTFFSLKRIMAIVLAFAVALCIMPQSSFQGISADAASSYWKFDFGANGTASGYTGVTASTSYSSSTGYGFSSNCTVTNVSAAGSGALSDAVQFTNSTNTGTATFCADVPNGLYQVTVWLGNTNRTSVAAEGMLQLINLTGNNATDTFQIPVTDGQLNICCCAGKTGYAFTLSALEISQISTSTETNPTIWICGDSTVCNYYPLDTSTQAGWGQMLPSVIGTDKWQVRNMAASGQYAAGFVSAGQFTAIETYGKAGDYYFISIGINDTNYSDADEYYATVKDMAQRAMAKGMKVVLVKQQGRAGDISYSPLLTGRWFGSTLDTIGSELGIQVIDLFTLWQNYCLSIGQDAVYDLYMDGDTLHPNRAGATILAQLIAGEVDFNASTISGAEFDNNSLYMIKNVNSGLFLTAQGGVAANNTNVCQSSGLTGITPANTWKLVKSSVEGYYYLYSGVGDGNTYMLDVAYAAIDNGTNIGIYENTYCDAQLFKFHEESSGVYTIRTKVTSDASCIGVTSGSTEDGANVIEWAIDGTANQNWQVIKINPAAVEKPYWQGDLNGDETINAVDTLIMKRGMTGGFDNLAAGNAAEISGDFAITGADAKILNQYILTRDYQFADAKYFAVDAMYAMGSTENTNAGFSKEKYLNLDNITGSTMTYIVNVPYTGNYLCSFKMANASANDRAMMISVSGSTDIWLQSFLTTSAWTTWEERGIVLPLKKGINTISLTSTMGEGAPNMDYVRLSFTDEPIAEPYVPTQEEETPEDTDGITVYIASDSTAQSYKSSYAPQQGWGYYLGNYFGDGVTVSNHAIAGRSSKSFYDNGRLTTILDSIQSGDYLIVCFGINDGASSNAERYAPVCGYVDNPAQGSFEYYMSFYIEGALNKGATPILMSPTLSIKNQTQPFTVGYRNIDSACRMLADKYDIPYFDLGQAMTTQFNSTAYDTVYSYYMGSTTDDGTDFTHFTETGANVVANIIANGIKGLGISLSNYVS